MALSSVSTPMRGPVRSATQAALRRIFGNSSNALVNQVATIFAAGKTGYWQRPGILASLFQDSAGTTLVTMVEQPVGLVLDNSKGATTKVLYAASRPDLNATGTTPPTVINGTPFLGLDTTAVTFPALAAGGFGVSRGSGEGGTPSQVLTEENAVYRVRFKFAISRTLVSGEELVVYSTGSSATTIKVISSTDPVNQWIDTGLLGDPNKFAGVHYPVVFAATALSAPVTVYISEYYAETILGNHATQATAAARPVLSSRVNLALSSEDVASAVWGNSGYLLGLDALACPSGPSFLVKLTATATPSATPYSIGAAPAGVFVVSFYVNTGSRGSIDLLVRNGTTALGYGSTVLNSNGVFDRAGWIATALGGGIFRVSYVVTTGFNPGDILQVYYGAAGAVTPGLFWYASGMQIESGATVTRYQRVNTATDYDTAGFPKYLKFDGVDDSLSSATGGGGTAGFFFCAAVRRASGGGFPRIFTDKSVGNDGYYVDITSGNALRLVANEAVSAVSAEPVGLGVLTLITAWDDGTNLNVQVGPGAINSVARPTIIAGSAGFTIGKNQTSASEFFSGNLYSPVYVRNTGLTAAERLTIQRQVAVEAGVTL